MVGIIYNKYYKIFAPRLKFSFKAAGLGESRKTLSIFIFKILEENDKISTSKIVSWFKTIFIKQKDQEFTYNEQIFIEEFDDRDIKSYQRMLKNYPKTFDKYFTDLVTIIRMLKVSVEAQIIIGADFSAAHFGRYLLDNNINLLTNDKSGETLFKAIRDIFYFT
jgi:hypothetical protein